MNETKLLLSTSPGDPTAKAEFLATVEPIHLPLPHSNLHPLPFQITLDGYTREPWASSSTASQQCAGYLRSTDGRNKLPGFYGYLRSRKKAAFARLGAAVFVVPFDPPSIHPEELPNHVKADDLLFVMYLRDGTELAGAGADGSQRPPAVRLREPESPQKPTPAPPLKKMPIPCAKKGGLLGNLLGAQRRTENHLHLVRAPQPDSNSLSGAAAVISSFRDKVSSDLALFQNDPVRHTTQISISLSTLVRTVPVEERDKLTMDVLKYVVYEQVEEVGGDGWIAAKEPGAFMDECVIAVYKEGRCPESILQELNKGEFPDEIKGQVRHIAETQSKMIQRKDRKQTDQLLQQSANQMEHVVLNTNKRDRRTLEQIQRDLMETEKRSRLE